MREQRKRELYLFFAVIVAVNLGLGFSDGLFSNYFKDVYHTDGFMRGLIELPREMPGVITFFLISAVSFLGDITIAIFAQGIAAIGLMVLGLVTPSFGAASRCRRSRCACRGVGVRRHCAAAACGARHASPMPRVHEPGVKSGTLA